MQRLKSLSLRQLVRGHLPALLATATAVLLLALTPFWAYRWYHEPFLGLGLELSNVVSNLDGQNWPGRKQGVRPLDQLVAINDTPVKDVHETNARVQARAYQRLFATFEGETGGATRCRSSVRCSSWICCRCSSSVHGGLAFLTIAVDVQLNPSSGRAVPCCSCPVTVILLTFPDAHDPSRDAVIFLAILLTGGGLYYLALVFRSRSPSCEDALPGACVVEGAVRHSGLRGGIPPADPVLHPASLRRLRVDDQRFSCSQQLVSHLRSG
jgi:hypothetical protein